MTSQVPFISLEQIVGTTQVRLTTTRRDLMAAFDRVVELSGRQQTTDLHVRRLLNYIRAHDKYYKGVAKSMQRLANKLVLSISTCRRVIRRAVEHFGLLIVISQRHYPGGQSYNRYTINWDHVDALLCDEDRENAHLEQAKQVAKDLTILAEANCPSGSDPGNTDVPVGSSCCRPEQAQRISGNPNSLASTIHPSCNDRAPANEMSDLPVRLGPNEMSDMPVVLRPRTCPHTSLPNAMCWACRDQALASGIKLTPGWMLIDSQLEGPIYYDQPPPPHLRKVFDRLARTPRPSNANLTPRGQTPPFPIKLPKEIAPEMLAHLDTLLEKVQAALKLAKRLKATRVYDRLFKLLCKMEPVRFQANNPAMCRIYLPPLTPEPEYVWDLKPFDWTAISNEMAAHQFDWTNIAPTVIPDPQPFDFSQFNFTPDALSDHPPTPNDQSLENNDPELLPVRLAPAVISLSSQVSLASELERLLTTIGDLLASIKPALRCARAIRLRWLQRRLLSWRGRLKTIRARASLALNKEIEKTLHACALN